MNSVALNKAALDLQSLYFDGRKDQTITKKTDQWENAWTHCSTKAHNTC